MAEIRATIMLKEVPGTNLFVIINPVSGGGRGRAAWTRIRPVLRAAGMTLAEAFVERPGRAEEHAARAAGQGYDLMVAVGGDGTVNETLNGLLRGRSERPPALAVIPGGTGNIFARGLGIPRAPMAAAGLFFHGVLRRVDIGQVNDRYFAAAAGVGFDAAVAARARGWPRWLDGVVRHVGAGLVTLATYRAPDAVVTIDGHRHTLPLYFLVAANTGWYGAGIHIAPHAQANDGRLAVVYATDLTRREVLTVLFKTFSGSHLQLAKVGVASAIEISVESDAALPIQADGEIVGGAPATFRCLPGALEVLVPRPAPEG